MLQPSCAKRVQVLLKVTKLPAHHVLLVLILRVIRVQLVQVKLQIVLPAAQPESVMVATPTIFLLQAQPASQAALLDTFSSPRVKVALIVLLKLQIVAPVAQLTVLVPLATLVMLLIRIKLVYQLVALLVFTTWLLAMDALPVIREFKTALSATTQLAFVLVAQLALYLPERAYDNTVKA